MSTTSVTQKPPQQHNFIEDISADRREYLRALAWNVHRERQAAREILRASDRAIVDYCLLLDGRTDDPEDIIYRLEQAFDKISDIYAAENNSRRED